MSKVESLVAKWRGRAFNLDPLTRSRCADELEKAIKADKEERERSHNEWVKSERERLEAMVKRQRKELGITRLD